MKSLNSFANNKYLDLQYIESVSECLPCMCLFKKVVRSCRTSENGD